MFHFTKKRCFRSASTLHLDKILFLDDRFPLYPTRQPILIDQLPLASVEKDILRKKGKPTCIHTETIGPYAIKVIGYHERVEHLPVRIVFFLHDHKLCFAEYLFAPTTNSPGIPTPGKKTPRNHIQWETIREMVCTRYLPGESIEAESFYIQDPAGNRLLFYFNGISINIKYLDPNRKEAKNPDLLKLFSGNGMFTT